MADPILRVRFTVQGCRLDVDGFVCGVVVYVLHGGYFACEGGFEGDGFEEGGDDEVDVLSWVWGETHHCEGEEGAHGA